MPSVLFCGEANPKPTPVFATDINGYRQIMHDLAGVPFIGLQEKRLSVATTANAGGIIEYALAATLDQINFIVTGNGMIEAFIVGREVTILIHCSRINDRFMTLQNRLLNRRERLIRKAIVSGVKLLRVGPMGETTRPLCAPS